MIEMRNISKSFSEKFLLKDFSIEINDKEKVQIIGKSGIGKSTIFKMLLGFEWAEKGDILLDGVKMDEMNCWEFRKQMAYVSQDLQIGTGPVEQMFQETWKLKANLTVQKDAKGKLYELLDLFELNRDILKQNMEKLSGGEKQRIAIINALLLHRKYLLLDEFSSALDARMKEIVFQLLMSMEDKTIIFISHDTFLNEHYGIRTIHFES